MFQEEKLKTVINEILAPFVAERALFIVDIKVSASSKIMVFVDGMENIRIEQCAEISRFLEAYLEENGLVGEKYTMEVSSPGMGSPLLVEQQYEKSINKPVEVLMDSGIKIEGTLLSKDENSITLKVEKKVKQKVVEEQEVNIPRLNIKSIIRPIKFS
ncbi:MAG: ribosome assembly cofactor RimP [Bacteroidetes bacterium]|jgi:ribosome maturation factor RimP|nr:ribosome assembly cofactor RimP [Bacteroidota bacterium]MBK7137621.1 ribosome assembly cofactor RimP [Bacteroidota bacterium]MBK8674552.1 ribosome assembly cofactor RimP [Bacteroidota bacterium]MBK9352776.1 ribosome assembly cofactor RimP [Bacteroidota bacterium]MBL0079189.1 ribosome assembly cofactor RimP [Bacteroidota bacterium]